MRKRWVTLMAGFVATVGVAPSMEAQTSRGYAENEFAVMLGAWLGDEFVERTLPGEDPFEGPVVFGSNLTQGNTFMAGLQVTTYFAEWFGADLAVGFVFNDWTSVGGRVVGDVVTGPTEVFRNVVTIPFSVNALVRVPGLEGLPRPYVSGGLGGVFYEFDRSQAPLQVTTVAGMPLDTVLFDLDLGTRPAPNGAVGVQYHLTERLGLRMEGRLWWTIVKERVSDETIVQQNKWVILSTEVRF